MIHKPFPVGTVVLIKGYRGEFTIESSYPKIRIHCGDYSESIMYTVLRKDGFITQVDDHMVILKNASESDEVNIKNLSTSELFETYLIYKDLYVLFGDDEYLDRLTDIKQRIKNTLTK